MFLAYFLNFKKYNETSSWKTLPTFKWVIGLVFIYIFMIYHAIDPITHKEFTINLIKLVVIVLIAYKLVGSERSLDVILWTYIIGCTYVGYVATVTGRDGSGRVEGIGMIDGGDSNGVASVLAPSLILLIYFFWLGSKKTKAICALCGALIANAMVLVNSRGGFLAIVTGASLFLLYMIFSRYQRKGQRLMAILTIVFGMSGGLYVADDTFWERMRTLQNIEDGQESGSHRIEFWLATFDVLKDYPLGVGINGYEIVSRNYLPDRYFSRQGTKAVHSTWFQLLGEVGWVGFIVFLFMLGSIYRLTRATKKYLIKSDNFEAYFKVLAIECSFICYLVAASFINRARAEIMFWMILFMSAAANVYYLQYVTKSNDKTSRSGKFRKSLAD